MVQPGTAAVAEPHPRGAKEAVRGRSPGSGVASAAAQPARHGLVCTARELSTLCEYSRIHFARRAVQHELPGPELCDSEKHIHTKYTYEGDATNHHAVGTCRRATGTDEHTAPAYARLSLHRCEGLTHTGPKTSKAHSHWARQPQKSMGNTHLWLVHPVRQ